ncbi:PREDICTED: uncharacterized protein LOC107086017 [Cyprinodon variegatus]|uniref:uncharacterized protein LOC107086017 n=1 Tax=Cyprinodon variegatus TaxID=28743 RepID=UPI000742A74F|nr:PREDICTED: uncharacterized protein LOC107086017 [Cyprinodon variegatus]
MDAYRRAAPHLLNKLAHLLSQHKWSQKDCIPSGIVNILNYSWHDLTAGASLRLRSRVAMTEKQGRSKVSLKREKTPRQVAEPAKEERGERNCCVVRNAGSFWRKVEVKKWEKKNKRTKRASNSTAVRFSISACSSEDPGGIAQPKQHLCDEPESVQVIQWAVERLRAARNPQKIFLREEEEEPRLDLWLMLNSRYQKSSCRIQPLRNCTTT